MNTIDSSKEKQYIQQIFDVRLEKSEAARCPNCSAPASESFRPSRRTKLWYCVSCLQTVAPLSQTIFANTHLPIELWLHIIRMVLEKGKEIQAKFIHYELGLSMRCSYRLLNKVQAWQSQNNYYKHRRKGRKAPRKYRTSLHIIHEMVLRSVPPLFNNASSQLKNKQQ